jgi:hypothetical protein
VADQRISEQQLQALDDADEYSLRHHSSDVSLLVESYRAALLEIATLRSGQFIPGVMHCAKCNFQLTKRVLCIGSGTIGAGDNKTEPCPNGCGPLWPVTWKQADDENQEIIGRLCDENRELRAELEALKKPGLRLVTGFNTKCLACGQHHAGMAGLPCPNMTPMAGGPADA